MEPKSAVQTEQIDGQQKGPIVVNYLRITEVQTSKLTRHWNVESTSGHRLGVVKFFPRWRCYSFFPADDTTFNGGCLSDLAAFCDQQTAAWREEVKARG